MADWRDRSEIIGDVVYFRYVTPGVEQNIDEIFVWDLDKTYLDTAIDSLSALIRTAIERAFNKKNVAGTNTLLQVLSQTWLQKKGSRDFLFISFQLHRPKWKQESPKNSPLIISNPLVVFIKTISEI